MFDIYSLIPKNATFSNTFNSTFQIPRKWGKYLVQNIQNLGANPPLAIGVILTVNLLFFSAMSWIIYQIEKRFDFPKKKTLKYIAFDSIMTGSSVLGMNLLLNNIIQYHLNKFVLITITTTVIAARVLLIQFLERKQKLTVSEKKNIGTDNVKQIQKEEIKNQQINENQENQQFQPEIEEDTQELEQESNEPEEEIQGTQDQESIALDNQTQEIKKQEPIELENKNIQEPKEQDPIPLGNNAQEVKTQEPIQLEKNPQETKQQENTSLIKPEVNDQQHIQLEQNANKQETRNQEISIPSEKENQQRTQLTEPQKPEESSFIILGNFFKSLVKAHNTVQKIPLKNPTQSAKTQQNVQTNNLPSKETPHTRLVKGNKTQAHALAKAAQEKLLLTKEVREQSAPTNFSKGGLSSRSSSAPSVAKK
jgi:hypothetical protein